MERKVCLSVRRSYCLYGANVYIETVQLGLLYLQFVSLFVDLIETTSVAVLNGIKLWTVL